MNARELALLCVLLEKYQNFMKYPMVTNLVHALYEYVWDSGMPKCPGNGKPKRAEEFYAMCEDQKKWLASGGLG